MDKLSHRRLKENELIFKKVNESVADFINESKTLAQLKDELAFYCECSDVNCIQRIAMDARTYKKLHKKDNQFTVLAGHQIHGIEKIVKNNKNFLIVEKCGEMPKIADIDIALPKLAA
jgi:hypothetical protein